MKGLERYLHEAEADSEVRVILIRAAGERAFTAGFDLNETVANNINDVPSRRADTKSEVDFFMYMWNLPKPVISAVQGYCIGGGITISMMSDMIIAADNARFGNPEVRLGYTMEIPMEFWKMPMNKAVEWFYLSRYFSADELAEMGVVNKVVPAAELWEKSMEIAAEIAKVPPQSMRIMKENIRKIYDIRGLSNTVAYTAEMFNLNRMRMQMEEMAQFGKDLNEGGLRTALDSRYN